MKTMTAILVLLSSGGLTAQTTPQLDFRVSVKVTGESDLVSEIGSYLRRELRSFDDVRIVDERPGVPDETPGWQISVVGMRVKPSGPGPDLGYALAVLVTQPVDSRELLAFVGKENAEIIKAIAADMTRVANFNVWTGPPDRLRSLCESIVAEFDTKHLEVTRQLAARHR